MEIKLYSDPIQTNCNLDFTLLFQIRKVLSCLGIWANLLKETLLL
jgi:hypothetical protein